MLLSTLDSSFFDIESNLLLVLQGPIVHTHFFTLVRMEKTTWKTRQKSCRLNFRRVVASGDDNSSCNLLNKAMKILPDHLKTPGNETRHTYQVPLETASSTAASSCPTKEGCTKTVSRGIPSEYLSCRYCFGLEMASFRKESYAMCPFCRKLVFQS